MIKQMAREVYVRHGKKEYNNGKSDTYKLDPDIIDIDINPLLDKLNDISFVPNIIVCSPFLRARSTAELINRKYNVDIICDPYIGECLTNQKTINSKEDFREETNKHNIYMERNYYKFRNRISKFFKTRRFVYKDTNILYVTHGSVIYEIALNMGIKLGNRKPGYLGTLITDVQYNP
jgi:broad specificity phosphatase PhoE